MSNPAMSALRQERLNTIVALCDTRPHTVSELSEALKVNESAIRHYVNPLVTAGKLFRALNRDRDYSVGFFATSPEAAELAAGSAFRVVRKAWVGKIPPMFEPMAHLYGRAA